VSGTCGRASSACWICVRYGVQSRMNGTEDLDFSSTCGTGTDKERERGIAVVIVYLLV
jgi:hypothetical protein